MDGSIFSGSKSSKFAIRRSLGTTTVIGPPSEDDISRISSAGKIFAFSNQGTTPKEAQSVLFFMIVSPSSNKLMSPRNLLIMNPFIR